MEEDKRQRVVDLSRAGTSTKDIADIVGIDPTTVRRVLKKFADRGTVERKSGTGSHQKKQSKKIKAKVKRAIKKDSALSMRKVAKKANVHESTVRRAVKQLGMKSYVRRQRQLITEKTRKTREAKAKVLLNWVKHHGNVIKIFSDEKLWTVDQARNSRNDRYLASEVNEVPPVNRTKHPASAMMLGVVASDGEKMPPHWFPKGLKIGAKEYIEVMQMVVKPWLDVTYPNGGYVFQQDSAPGHKAKVTQKWCTENLAGFWPWTMWPPSSPDLNPLDYGIWSALQPKACATSHASVNALKLSVEKEWSAMDTDFIVATCQSFRPRLEAMVDAKGGLFEL